MHRPASPWFRTLRGQAGGRGEDARQEDFRAGYAAVSADSFPNVSAMSNEVASLGFDSDFQSSLDLRLEGLERRGTASSGEHYNCLEPTSCDDRLYSDAENLEKR